MSVIIAYIPCKDNAEAERVSRHLLEKKIIACANIVEARSLYSWKGSLADETESIIIAKSDKRFAKKIMDDVKKIHSYELPCIEIIESKANKEYEDWVKKQLR